MNKLEKINSFYLTPEEAGYLIKEWNYKIHTYGRVPLVDLEIFLNMLGGDFELQFIDSRWEWIEPIDYNHGLKVEVSNDSIRVKLDLKPYTREQD